MDRVRSFFNRGVASTTSIDSAANDEKEQERARLEALDAATIARLAGVFVSEVQAVLKRADPDNAEYDESWSDELLDIFIAQETDREGSLIGFTKNRFFAMKCIDAEVHVHLVYCFTALKLISEKYQKDTTRASVIIKNMMLAALSHSLGESLGGVDSIPRPQLTSLLSLSVARYNSYGVPVQRSVREVVVGLFGKGQVVSGLSNSLMWYLHEKTTINHLAHDLASIVLSDLEGDSNLNGDFVEEVWVNGILSIVTIVVDSCKHGGALLEDFEKANGYVVFTEILRNCSVASMPILLSAVVSLTFASISPLSQEDPSRTRSVSSSSDTSSTSVTSPSSAKMDGDRLACNLLAFKLLRDLLLLKNTVLAKCIGDGAKMEELSQGEFSNQVIETSKRCAEACLAPNTTEKAGDSIDAREEVCQQILDTVLQVYSRHPDNCALLEPKFHMLGLFFAGLSSFRASEVKHMIHSTLEFVSIGASGDIPVHALQAAGLTFLGLSDAVLLSAANSDSEGFSRVLKDVQSVKNTLVRLISFDNSLGEVLCSCGLMDTVLVPLLERISNDRARLTQNQGEGSSEGVVKWLAEGALSIGVMACGLLDALLRASPHNVQRYRDLNAENILVAISRYLDHRATAASALKVLGTVAALHSTEEQLKISLLSLSETVRVKGVWRQCEVFNTVRSILSVNFSSKDIWRDIKGFELMIETLKSFKDMFTETSICSESMLLENMRSVLLCLLESLRGDGEVDSFEHFLNRKYVRDIGYNTIAKHLVCSGIFAKSKTDASDARHCDAKLLHLLFCLIAGGSITSKWGQPPSIAPLTISAPSTLAIESNSLRPPTIMNADAVLLLLDCTLIECLNEVWSALVVKQVIELAQHGGSAAFHRLAHAGVTTYLCTNKYYQQVQESKKDAFKGLSFQINRLIQLIGTSSMDVTDLSSSLIGLAGSMVKHEKVEGKLSMPYNKFDMVANMRNQHVGIKKEENLSTLATLLSLANAGQSESCAHLGSQTPSRAGFLPPTSQSISDAYGRELKMAHSESEAEPTQILSKVASQTKMNILTIDDAEHAWNPNASYSLVFWFKYDKPLDMTGTSAVSALRPPSPLTPSPQPPLELDSEGKPVLASRTFSDSEDDGDDVSADGFALPVERLSLWSAQSLHPNGGFIFLYFDIQSKCFTVGSAQTSHPQSVKEIKQVAAFTCSLVEPDCWFNLTLVHVRTKRMLASKETLTLFLNGQSLGVAKLDTPRLENPVLQVFGCPPPAVLHVLAKSTELKSTSQAPPPPPPSSMGSPNLSSVVRVRGLSLAKKQVSRQESFGRKSPTIIVYPRWSMGPVRVLSEVVSSHGALAIYALGPAFSGNFRGGMPPESVLSVVLLSRLSRIDHASDNDIHSMLSYPTTALPPSSSTSSSLSGNTPLNSSPLSAHNSGRWDAGKVRHESLLSKLHIDESFKISEERKDRMDANLNMPSSNNKLLEANDLDDMHLGVNSFVIGSESIMFSVSMQCIEQKVVFSNQDMADEGCDPWKVGDAKIYSNSLHVYNLKATSDVSSRNLSQVVLHGAYDALVQRSTMARVVHGASAITSFFPLIANAQSSQCLSEVLKVLLGLVHGHQGNLEYMHSEGYTILGALLYHKFHLFSDAVVDILFQFAVLVFNVKDAVHDDEDVNNNSLLNEKGDSWLLVDLFAAQLLLLNTQLWLGKVKKGDEKTMELVQPLFYLLKLFSRLLSSESNFAKTNSKRLLCEPLNFIAHVIHILIEIDSLLNVEHPSPLPQHTSPPQVASKSQAISTNKPQINKKEHKEFLLSLFSVGSELLTVLFWKTPSNRDCYLLAQAALGTAPAVEEKSSNAHVVQSQTEMGCLIQVNMLDQVFRMTTSDPCCSIPSSHGAVPLCIDLLVKCLSPDWFIYAVKSCVTSSTTAGLLLRLGCRLLQRYQTVDTRSLGIAAALRELSASRVSASLILPACFLLAGCDIVHCPWNNNSHQENLTMRTIDDFWAIIETSVQKSTQRDEDGNEKKDVTSVAGGCNMEELCYCGFSLLLDMLKKLWMKPDQCNYFTDSGDMSNYDSFIVELLKRIVSHMPKVNSLVRSKRFLKPLIELLFVCMDNTESEESGGMSPEKEGGHSRSSELSVISDPALFCGRNGLDLFPIFESLLATALSESTPLSPFMNNMFSAMPKRDPSMLLTYQGFVLKIMVSALPLSLNNPSEVVYVNATTASKIILEHAIRGLFTTATIEVALEIALSVVRAVCGNKAAVILEAKQRQIIAEAVFSAQHLVIIALHRCSVNGAVSPSVLSLVRKHSSLLLQRSFAGSAAVGLTNSSSSERDLSKTSAFQMSHQDTDELLVINLVGECMPLITLSKDETIKTDLLHIMSTVLKQRRLFAREVIMPEATRTMEGFVDIMTEGFDLLAQSNNRSADFMFWLQLSPQKEAVQKSFERAAMQSQKMNPKLACELPSLAAKSLQENNATASFPSSISQQPSSMASKSTLSLSTSSMTLSTASSTPCDPSVLATLHDHWKIEGSEFIARGKSIYPTLVHRMSGLSIWEGRQFDHDLSSGPVQRFWKLLNHQGPDGARRRLVVNSDFHTAFEQQTSYDGTLVYVPISNESQSTRSSQEESISEKEKQKNETDTSSTDQTNNGSADTNEGNEEELEGTEETEEMAALRSSSALGDEAISLESLRRLTRRSMTMARKVRDDSYDDLMDEDEEEEGTNLNENESGLESPEVGSMDTPSLLAELSLNDTISSEVEAVDTYVEESEDATTSPSDLSPEALLKGTGAHEVAVLKGVLNSSDWPPLRCFNIKIVSGLDTTRSALLLVSTQSVSIVEGFGVPPQVVALERGAVRVVGTEKEVGRESSYEVNEPLRLPYNTLLVAYKRRHQLRPVALEFFNTDGSSVLTAFESEQDSEEMLGRIMSTELPRSLFAKYSGAGGVPQLSKVSFASMRVFGKNKYKSFITTHRKHMTKKWQSGELSNFEYLMHLNTMAGRSFHDLTQYPVMPWVIADYESAFLDLNSPTTFRDLSQPMGALGAARAAQFKERYESLDELREGDESSIRPFHYGTHYSCAGYVLYYLVRLEPFSRLALQLQGGKFDKPDRLFRDVAASWRSASSENIQDVRELIPEFFSLPDFLVNSNRFEFGEPQKGPKIWDVSLPPWAHGDPHEFVRMQRAALESRYVSERLHLWIDLVFGFKQRGIEAVKAQNVFVHITYENEVDLDAIEDPLERDATLSQIQNFGQTPSRLFAKRPHPARIVPEIVKLVDPATGSAVVNAVGVLAGSKTSRSLESQVSSLTSVSSPSQALQQLLRDPNKPYTVSVDSSAVAWHKGLSPPLCVIGATHRTSLVCSHVSSLSDHTHHAPFPTTSANATALVHSIHTNQVDGGGAVAEIMFAEENSTGHSRKILCAKQHSFVVQAIAIKKKVLTFSIHDCGLAVSGREKDSQVFENLHIAAVSCLTCSDDGSLIVTGGEDAVVHVWEFSKISTHKSLGLSAANQVNSAVGRSSKLSNNRFELSLRGTLNGHAKTITHLNLSMMQGLLVSGSEDGKVVMWDLKTCSFLHELPGHSSPLKALSISPTTGDVMTLAGIELRMWDTSGGLRALTDLSKPGVNEVEFNDYMSNATTCCSTGSTQWCLYEGVGVVLGHESGMISLWRLKQRSKRTSKEGNTLPDEFELCSSIPAEMHQQPITCVRVASRGQDLLVGDMSGLVTRWAAQRLDGVTSDDALALLLKD